MISQSRAFSRSASVARSRQFSASSWYCSRSVTKVLRPSTSADLRACCRSNSVSRRIASSRARICCSKSASFRDTSLRFSRIGDCRCPLPCKLQSNGPNCGFAGPQSRRRWSELRGLTGVAQDPGPPANISANHLNRLRYRLAWQFAESRESMLAHFAGPFGSNPSIPHKNREI